MSSYSSRDLTALKHEDLQINAEGNPFLCYFWHFINGGRAVRRCFFHVETANVIGPGVFQEPEKYREILYRFFFYFLF